MSIGRPLPPTRSPAARFGRALPRHAVVFVLTWAAYVASGLAENQYARAADQTTHIWWPIGFAAAAAFRFGPAAVLAALAGEATTCAWHDVGWRVYLFTGLGNAAEAVLVVWVLRTLRFAPKLDRPRDVLALLAAAAVGPVCMVPPLAIVRPDLPWMPTDEVPIHAVLWWTGDGLAVLFLGGVLHPLFAARKLRRRELLGPAAAAAGVAALTAAAFLLRGWAAVLLPAAFASLLAVAYRFGPVGAAVALAAHAATAVACVGRADTPFPNAGYPTRYFPYLHAYLALTTLTTLLLAAARAERRRTERDAQTARRLDGLQRLAGGVAHEFNNLMTVVLGNAELLKAGPPPGIPPDALLDQIAAAAERAGRLTRQLLAYTGQHPTTCRPLAPAADLRAAAERYRVRLDLPAGLPPVTADAGLLTMAVDNLLKNAIEACGGDAGKVSLSADLCELSSSDLTPPLSSADARPGPHLRVRVADDGPGVPDAVRGSLFEPFASTHGPGRGLGLAAAAGAVKACGGTIRHTDRGPGSAFDIFMPVSDTDPTSGDA